MFVLLLLNRIADSGERTLYVKLFAPNGKDVDAPENNKAVVGGVNSGYNGMVKVNSKAKQWTCVSLRQSH